jgi:hypothetical protein
MPKKALHHIVDIFPGRWARICELYESDAEFRMICEDYDDLIMAKRRLRESCDNGAAARKHEYEQVAHELKAELRAMLDNGELAPAGRHSIPPHGKTR